jgi:hypothetical protein
MGAGHIAMVVIGAILVIAAIVLPTVIVPSLEKLPAQLDVTSHLAGKGTVLDPQTFKPVGPLPVAVTRSISTRSTSGDVVVLNQTVTTTLAGRPLGEPATSVLAVDRTTNRHVAGFGSDVKRSGQALGMPWHAQKSTYPFWDDTARRTLPARFVAERTVSGLPVYEYSITTGQPVVIGQRQVPGAALGAPGTVSLDVTYSREGTLLVDPLTGTPVSATDHSVQALARPGTTQPLVTLADVTVSTTPADRASTIDTVSSGHQMLTLVRMVIPIIAAVLGLALLALGLRRRRA